MEQIARPKACDAIPAGTDCVPKRDRTRAMRITANSGTALNTAFLARRPFDQKADEAPAGGKHLILRAVAATPSPAAALPARPLAAFLAQLIAKAQDLPVSRERRRADPAEGARVYRAAGLAPEGKQNRTRDLIPGFGITAASCRPRYRAAPRSSIPSSRRSRRRAKSGGASRTPRSRLPSPRETRSAPR
jgi:hypothetical protein